MKDTLKILFIGDIFGKVGRNLVIQKLPKLIEKHKIDFVVANGENATHGKSISLKHYEILKDAGIDVFTMGNHIFGIKETLYQLDDYQDLLRPANYLDLPGFGTNVFQIKKQKIRITNLSGRTFMRGEIANPFTVLEEIISNDNSDYHFVDFHAEATAEKIALAWENDGKITGLVGTHTHVPTSDSRILPKQTFFISDLGMTGPHNSIIGAEPKYIIEGTKADKKFKIIPAGGDGQFCGVLLTLDSETKKVTDYLQIYQIYQK